MPAGYDSLLVVVLGPTASGKTSLSIAIAEQLAGEIVNCDSVALYRDFEIGTAKPTREERARVPHHLLDVADPLSLVTAGEYARQARQVLSAIKTRGRVPIVAGGTGLYLRALLEGIFPGPQRSEAMRKRLRSRAAECGPSYLHKILRRLDKDAARLIHPNDIPKLIRAIEVCLAEREKMTKLWAQGRDPLSGFKVFRIGLNPDRKALYQRIDERARRMFDNGLIDETKVLLQRYGPEAWPLSSLGYRQAVQFLRGELDQASAVKAAQQAHRNYAKRQMTWFRREPEVRWYAGFGDDPEIQREVMAAVEAAER